MPQRERIATWPTGRANRMSARKVEVLSGARVLTYAEIDTFNMFALDANGAARNVDLPAVGSMAGAFLFISNKAAGAFALTVRDAAAATITVIAQSESALIWSDGISWYAMTGAVNS